MTDVDVTQDEESYNICPFPSVISTDSPESEVWNHIGQLTSLSYVRDFLKRRLKSDFFEDLWQNLEEINKKKLKFNATQNKPDDILKV